jgi:hypothetical protein
MQGIIHRFICNMDVCVNAIYAGSVDADAKRWLVTQAMIEAEIKKARKTKEEHSGEKVGQKRRIGFQQG